MDLEKLSKNLKLDKHIANRFLNDKTFLYEIISHQEKDTTDPEYENRVNSLYEILSPKNNKSFYCTKTVIDLLDQLKVYKKDGEYDWTVFYRIKQGKYTFIFPNNALIRLFVSENHIHITFLEMKMVDELKGYSTWHMFFVNKTENRKCEHFQSNQVQSIEEFVYKLLCFVFLTENEEVLLPPKGKTGTKASGKLINTLGIPLMIINSKWNITSYRTEGFAVRGHFAIRWTGEGRKIPKLVFINPFEKKGYVKKSKSKNIK